MVPKPHLICRIGARAYLVAGASTEFLEESFGRRITRQLDLLVQERAFTAFLLDFSLDGEALQPVGMQEFAAQLGLDASERSKLIAAIFRLVSQVFGLARDPVLRSELVELTAADGIAAGKMIAHRVDGIDTVICEASPRLKLDQGSLIVSFADHLVVGEIRAVEATICRGWEAMLAVVDFVNSPRNDRVLLISPCRLAVVEMEVRLNRSVEAFSESHARCRPELVNLLAIWNIGARTALALAGRCEPIVAAVAVSCFGFRFEITHAFSMNHGLFVSGWFVDPDRLLTELWVVDYGLASRGLCDKWIVAPARVSAEGEVIAVRQFHAFVERRAGSAAPANLTFVVELRNGERHALYCPGCEKDARAMRDGILSAINHAGFGPDTLVQAFLPAVDPLQAALNDAQCISEILDLGTRSARDISIVIPLCRELEFIRPQLIAFHADPVLRSNGQIIYVVGDPLIAHGVRQILAGAAHVFALDVRLVLLERDGGHALASNLGARQADGQALVLMKSDVVPEAPGWLVPMMERLALLPPSSVVGPKLIHADESLRHAGLHFHRLPDGQWQNRHLFRGYGRNFPPADVERDVPGLTSALMALRRDDYLTVGGFSTDFILGEPGDIDLCLKLRSRGGRCLYMPSATLFHFEPQPQPLPDRGRETGSMIYDRALCSLRWPETIAASTAGMPETRHAG